MAWCPFATKMELQPESDAQAAIRPTQMIFHSIVGPWSPRRTYEYWRDSTSLESHFGVGYPGDVAQYIGTETRADANYLANRRPDGTGAISVETASNTSATDSWTDEQVETLVRLGVWAHERHGVPLRICRSHSDPGFGYHAMFPEWSPSGTACPGPARIRQFKEIVFPGIVARAKEEDVPLTKEDVKTLWLTDGVVGVPEDWSPGNAEWMPASILVDIGKRVRALQGTVAAQGEAIKGLAAALAAHDEQIDADALVARIEAAIESVTVRLEVPDPQQS